MIDKNTDRRTETLINTFNAYDANFPLVELCNRFKKTAGRLFGALAPKLIRESLSRGAARGRIVWCGPFTRVGILSEYDKGFATSSSGELRNWRRYFGKLHKNNMIYGCGTSQSMIFAVEPNVLSWSVFSKNAMVYPETLLSILRSREEMFCLIKEGLAKSATPIDTIFKEVTIMISDLAQKLDPSIMAPVWDGELDSESYCRQLYRTLSLSPPLRGFRDEFIDVDAIGTEIMAKIKSPVRSTEFDELKPENEDVVPVNKVPKRSGVNPAYSREMKRLDDVPTDALDLVAGGPLHLLQAFQRFVFPEIGMPSPTYRAFQNYGQEEMYADNIVGTLLAVGKLNREVILSWINWYAVYMADESIVKSSTCALKLLFGTWKEFCAMSEGASWSNIVAGDDFPSDGPIYSRMSEFRNKSTIDRWFEECSMRFGYIMPYAFLVTVEGRDLSQAIVRDYFNNGEKCIEDNIKDDSNLRSRVMKSVRQMMVYEVPTAFRGVIKQHYSWITRHPDILEVLKRDIKRDRISLSDPMVSDFWSIIEGKLNLKSEEVLDEKHSRTQG